VMEEIEAVLTGASSGDVTLATGASV
jgi:hypothetical protein